MIYIFKEEQLKGYADNDAGIKLFLKKKGFCITSIEQVTCDPIRQGCQKLNRTFRVWDGGNHTQVSVLK